MKAVVFRAPGMPLSVEECPDPTPGSSEAVLKVARCGICGTDLHMTGGHEGSYSAGMIIGHEYAGEVVALGSGVTTLKVGDLVTSLPVRGCGQCGPCIAGDPMRCTGPEKQSASRGFAQYVLVNQRSTVRLPVDVSLADAALTEPFSCGLRGASRAGIVPGATVLVVGVGAIGLAAIFWARRMGAGKIVATARTDRAASFAQMLGATHFIRSNDQFDGELIEALGGPPDIVMECSGARGMIDRSVHWAKPGGRVVVLGFCTDHDSFVPATALLKETEFHFVNTYTRQQFTHCLDTFGRESIDFQNLFAPPVSFDEFPTVFEQLRTKNSHLKFMLDPWLERGEAR
ncbi:Zn-dependent alcohol dehydrogenase [Novosphingobium endophyticum]|uniref:Zn-dependent alcohol dehydrogenase n=1 Tax=Novosphingobium endophyticum TaxID=1955250 RepID=A0A916X5H8_9SPHN|nr:alcohol dehydrogenase catalytic domain-containing protein [Novosphingobium endophyticum]GGC00521.1 Zn-dependent alcohol dehydrogenase [Novosphingobium endophyticum]